MDQEQEHIYTPVVKDVQLSVPFSQSELTQFGFEKSNNDSQQSISSQGKLGYVRLQGAYGHKLILKCIKNSDNEVNPYFQFKCRCILWVFVTVLYLSLNYKQVYFASADANQGGRLSKWGTMSPNGGVAKGFRDFVLEYFEPLNQYFIAQHKYRHLLLIFSSGILDIMMTIQFCRWIRYGTTWRMVFASTIFYIIRALFQAVWLIEKPPGYAWEYPGLMSIYVGYGTTTDFFYSGHVGFCLLHHIEYKRVGWTKMKYFCIFVGLVETFTMVVLRSHYSIDIIFGVIIAHYIYILTEEYIHLFDWGFFRIPKEKAMFAGNVDFMAQNIQQDPNNTAIETSHTD